MNNKKEFNKQVAKNLRGICKDRQLKIQELENVMCVKKGYLSTIINTGSNISSYSLYKAMKYLDISIDELLEDIELRRLKEMANELGYEIKKK